MHHETLRSVRIQRGRWNIDPRIGDEIVGNRSPSHVDLGGGLPHDVADSHTLTALLLEDFESVEHLVDLDTDQPAVVHDGLIGLVWVGHGEEEKVGDFAQLAGDLAIELGAWARGRCQGFEVS